MKLVYHELIEKDISFVGIKFKKIYSTDQVSLLIGPAYLFYK